MELKMVLCSGVCSIMLRISEPSDRASDGLNLISAMNVSRLLVAEMKSKPLDIRSDDSKVRAQHQPELARDVAFMLNKTRESSNQQLRRNSERLTCKLEEMRWKLLGLFYDESQQKEMSAPLSLRASWSEAKELRRD
ncbi:hypothetical protein RHMOL_Rhmol13G0031200 [Rhododendron molle]|uniref:Uncharacterized protein n=1 Tax=Rhododendron molle TaxID=49168 RepID=A0ACC0L3S0_RHOML|nr:hypothetical protein RHMOL_Rhmol13G0031200 [Rhododendron molle]